MATTNNVVLLSTQEILGREVAVYGTYENPLFIAKDAAEWIDYTKTSMGAYDVSNMLRGLDENEKLLETIFLSGQNQDVWMLTESGVYKILMQNYNFQTKHIRKEIKKITVTLKRKALHDKANMIIENQLHNERWEDIPSFNGYYQASSLGRIRRTNRSFFDKNGKKTQTPQQILKACSGKTSPYLAVNLSVNNVSRKYMVHRLVAMTYFKDWLQDLEVNHIDGNVFNNCIDNIEMCTRKDNYKHAIQENLKMDYGQFSVNSKLSDIDAKRIRQLNDLGVQQVDLANVYKVCKQTISNIVNLKTYRKCK